MNQTLLITERGSVLGHGALSSLTLEQVCVIPAAQLEGENIFVQNCTVLASLAFLPQVRGKELTPS